MDKLRLKEGDWVKERTGTKGMTVVALLQTSERINGPGLVRCRFKQDDGTEAEADFKESDLARLD
jgi:uncharacterized protein YodC (DUF2158 family)